MMQKLVSLAQREQIKPGGLRWKTKSRETPGDIRLIIRHNNIRYETMYDRIHFNV